MSEARDTEKETSWYMDKSILHKYTGKSETEPAESNVLDLEITDDLGSFGWLRGIRDRCLMLELRKKDGNVLAIGYGYIERIEFDPSEGITLRAGATEVRIKGSNLNVEVRPGVRLFEGLTRHRVHYVNEANQSDTLELELPDGRCIVDLINW